MTATPPAAPPTVLTSTVTSWTCVKRDGHRVPFDAARVVRALERCFRDVGRNGDGAPLAARLTPRVIKALASHRKKEFGVEEVQRAVIASLWADDYVEEAESYQNFREARRLEREAKPIPAAYAAAVAEDAARFPNPIQYYQFIGKFARWREADKRRETWREACNRVMNWFRGLPRVKLEASEWAELDASLFHLETCCAMRVVQMAGPALERCHAGAYNCAYLPLSDLRAFAELLYVLMSGCGCGFSVEDRYISRLPRVARQRGLPREVYDVGDSTEGWCDAFLHGLGAWFDGRDVWFEIGGVRPKGARLFTKGGRSSGPGPLLELLAFARKLILSRQGKVLTDLDCHDLACMSGRIVQVGGVRRAACISYSDLDSVLMRDAKNGNWLDRARWRTMSNNSAVYDGRPDVDTFMSEMGALIKSKSGERGTFNIASVLSNLPARRKASNDIRGNPCQEIQLRPFGFCNLSITVPRPGDTADDIRRKVRVATMWGCMQKTATDFKYLRPEWKQNCEEEALIGVDITGHADCPLLRHGAPGRAELLRELKQIVAATDEKYSRRFGVNRSAADTCVKPSGDSGVFFDCASGVSPWFNDHVLRWVREQAGSPVDRLLKAEGVPHAPAPEDPSLTVFGFLRKAPPGSTLARDMTALDQLNNWLEWKENWAEHTVSCTIYVDEDEWPDVLAWLWKNFDRVSGLCFNPRDNGVYTYSPNESLTEEQYAEALAKFPAINWGKLCRYEDDDETTSRQTLACSGPGGCEV